MVCIFLYATIGNVKKINIEMQTCVCYNIIIRHKRGYGRDIIEGKGGLEEWHQKSCIIRH